MKLSQLADMRSINKYSEKTGVTLLEILACLLIMALILPSLSSLQSGTDRSLVKAGEFMVATAVLQNVAELYKIKRFEDIDNRTLAFDSSGNPASFGNRAFQIKIRVETVSMPNRWAVYKRIFLDVEKTGILFGTTLLKTVLLRSSWIREI
jgi:type II secretory pathway pseudopilin PulG